MGFSLGSILKGVGGFLVGGPPGAIAAVGQSVLSSGEATSNVPARVRGRTGVVVPAQNYNVVRGTGFGPVPQEQLPATIGTGRTVARQPSGNGTCDPADFIGPRIAEPIPTMRAPSGFVLVRCPRTGRTVALDRESARKAGLFKPRRKPPISTKDWETLKVADRVVKKLDTVVKRSDAIACKPVRRPKKRG